ncbi:DUF397 domain-containing protein [Amycolatopsis sp. RTGN1]|uniref:DUF397 domain-containing protein n=1 Tax=Amycolatopsis ponsaeliensis TaxID=2992142 RepID=UPI003306CC0E
MINLAWQRKHRVRRSHLHFTAAAVRDSKDPSGPHFAVDAWLGFLTAVTPTG